MKFIKKCPLFLLLLSTGLLFTIIAAGGKQNIYAQQEYSPLKAPLLSVMFTGLNEGIYPWQILDEGSVPVSGPADAGSEEMAEAKDPIVEAEDGDSSANTAKDSQTEVPAAKVPSQENASAEETVSSLETEENEKVDGQENEQGDSSLEESESEADQPKESPMPGTEEEGLSAQRAGDIPEGRLEPLRESTHEEYLNHISADIYGDAGVIRASAYEFAQVDESYFDDALFIGDSRTVGLRDYTDLSEHADFYCETSLTIYKVMEENFKGLGTVKDALASKDYGKIYLMVGINELGRGTTEDYMGKYTEVVDTLHALEPDAKIFIQGVMRVSGRKHGSDAIFNNDNINARNNAVATLADNKQIFYIDVNEVVCDEDGNLSADYTFDQIHLLGVYNDLWKQFLMAHGV